MNGSIDLTLKDEPTQVYEEYERYPTTDSETLSSILPLPNNSLTTTSQKNHYKRVCSSKIGRRFISSFILTDIPTIFSARALRPRVLPKKPSTDWREEIRKGIVTDKTGKNSFE
ncbi:4112_t:CDS:2 [Entrophospora sp. SA101]|nr:4112_t:CDS:2 [Entrophospora sp. SA101]CAJ0825076.1 16424_t:CDS:2 [Entrophospora sp. SA101]